MTEWRPNDIVVVAVDLMPTKKTADFERWSARKEAVTLVAQPGARH